MPAIVYHSEDDKYLGPQVIRLTEEQIVSYLIWKECHEVPSHD
jgi:hypothetical protein